MSLSARPSRSAGPQSTQFHKVGIKQKFSKTLLLNIHKSQMQENMKQFDLVKHDNLIILLCGTNKKTLLKYFAEFWVQTVKASQVVYWTLKKHVKYYISLKSWYFDFSYAASKFSQRLCERVLRKSSVFFVRV